MGTHHWIVHKTFQYRPDSVTVKARITEVRLCNPIDSIGYKAANMAYTETFEFRLFLRSGGSIPIVALFEKN
jgi:hypothetical protein